MHHELSKVFGVDCFRPICFYPLFVKREIPCLRFYLYITSWFLDLFQKPSTKKCLNCIEKENYIISLKWQILLQLLQYFSNGHQYRNIQIQFSKDAEYEISQKKNHPLAVTTLQANTWIKNRFSSHFLQSLCKCNQTGFRHAGRHFICVRINILHIY